MKYFMPSTPFLHFPKRKFYLNTDDVKMSRIFKVPVVRRFASYLLQTVSLTLLITAQLLKQSFKNISSDIQSFSISMLWAKT